MIRRGKRDGWLVTKQTALSSWASFHGVAFNGVDIRQSEHKGLAVFACPSVTTIDGHPLMRVPQNLILSKEHVELHAKSDVHLRSVLEALGEFGRTARGRILTFLLLQATGSCPEADDKIGLASPLTDYIKFLPMELLPTFWNDDELELLIGTSLAPAMDAKMNSLYREFELLRSSTADITWCQSIWWDEIDGILSFDDWKQVDAFYRSRALELPGVGDCMVPCVDMCNHASGARTSALFESDNSGDALLLKRDEAVSPEGSEITITYGDEKGACEMIFSYGFVEESMATAKDLFLDLEIPDDDPLRRAKQVVANSAPGVRLFEGSADLQWESDYIWLMCVNEEDGFAIEVVQLVDGSQQLQCSWNSEVLDDTSRLKELLQSEPLWNVFQLRVVALLQARVENQLRALYDSDQLVEERIKSTNMRQKPKLLALRLRALERNLLERFYEHYEAEKLRLAETEEVRKYLGQSMDIDPAEPEEDFS